MGQQRNRCSVSLGEIAEKSADIQIVKGCDTFQEGNAEASSTQKKAKSFAPFQEENDEFMDMSVTRTCFLFQDGNADVRNMDVEGNADVSNMDIEGNADVINMAAGKPLQSYSLSEEGNADVSNMAAVRPSSTVFSDLDYSSIEMLFCHLSPLNVCHLASVCQLWSSAASSSLVWRSFLPSGCISYLSKAFLEDHSQVCFLHHSMNGVSEDGLEDDFVSYVKSSCTFLKEHVRFNNTEDFLGKDFHSDSCANACQSKKSTNLKASATMVKFREIYQLFSTGCLIEEGRQLIRVDSTTNSLSLYVSVVSGMEATWSYGKQTYIKSKIPDPIFPQSAILLLDVSFCLNGHVRCWLPPGHFSCFWRLARDISEPDLEESKICSCIRHNVVDGECITREFPLSCVKIGGWEEVYVGEFVVTGQEEEGLCLFELYLSLYAMDTIWSSFINIDSFSFRKCEQS